MFFMESLPLNKWWPTVSALLRCHGPHNIHTNVAHSMEGISLFILCTVKDKNKNPLKFKRKFLYVCFKNSELDNGLKSRRERWDGLELFSQRKCVTGFSVTVWLTKGFKDVLATGSQTDPCFQNTNVGCRLTVQLS